TVRDKPEEKRREDRRDRRALVSSSDESLEIVAAHGQSESGEPRPPGEKLEEHHHGKTKRRRRNRSGHDGQITGFNQTNFTRRPPHRPRRGKVRMKPVRNQALTGPGRAASWDSTRAAACRVSTRSFERTASACFC